MIGVVFAAEKDATMFHKKVTGRKAEKGMRERCRRKNRYAHAAC